MSAPPPGFSQLAASFLAWQLLGIPRGPYFRLTILLFLSLSLSISKIRLEAGGLEPPTPGLQSRCSSQLSYAPFSRRAIGKGCHKHSRCFLPIFRRALNLQGQRPSLFSAAREPVSVPRLEPFLSERR